MVEKITLFSTPALSSSILTLAPGLPAEVQVMVWTVPRIQLSPPFGEVTVIVFCVKVAVTDLSVFMVIVAGLVMPVRSPLQPAKLQLGSAGTAVS